MRHLLFLAATLLAALAVAGVRAEQLATDAPTAASAPPYQFYLPIIFSQPLAPPYDMVQFMVGDHRLYEVQHSSGSQARHQTQETRTRFYHTKGDEVRAEWEELWATADTIFRGTDTSPGNGQFYTLYEDDVAGSAWSPRLWDVGDVYERNPFVVFYRKSDCGVVASGYQRSWLRFQAYYPTYTFRSGIVLRNVIELAWLLKPDGQPVETYFYAEKYGLVGWGSADHGYSYISWIHAPGQRPDNKREVIACLDATGQLVGKGVLNRGPLPDGFRAK